MGIKFRVPWKGELTARERFNRQMHGKSVDRSFNMEFGYWRENYEQWAPFAENGIAHEWQANAAFGFDRIEGVWNNAWMDPPFEVKEISRAGNRKTIQNEDGLTAEIPIQGGSTIPHYTKAAVITPDDWRRVKAARFRPDSPGRFTAAQVSDVLARHPHDRDYPLGVHCGSLAGKIRDMLTFEGICFAWYDYPDMLEDMVETCCVLVENFLDTILGRVEFDYATGWEDICFNHGPILPPKFFAEVVAPRYRRIAKRLHNHGIDLWYTDCDGDVRPLLPIFLASGINCLFPYEVNSCAHPGEVLDAYPGLRIMGGVDKMKMIQGGASLTDYLESLVPYVKRGGFIPFCDHRCPPDVTWENYLFYLDEKERLFGSL